MGVDALDVHDNVTCISVLHTSSEKAGLLKHGAAQLMRQPMAVSTTAYSATVPGSPLCGSPCARQPQSQVLTCGW